ncbi:MAG TPA: hypothetical protein VMT19_13265 [Thermoanaerobaculaceae bacterium]|nr:hypothetical protein [Thermoanaerobaculaceae bacterium]
MGTKHRKIWRAASMAIAALALTSTLSSCIAMRPWHRDRWDRGRRTYLERRHEDPGVTQRRHVEPRPWVPG